MTQDKIDDLKWTELKIELGATIDRIRGRAYNEGWRDAAAFAQELAEGWFPLEIDQQASEACPSFMWWLTAMQYEWADADEPGIHNLEEYRAAYHPPYATPEDEQQS